MASVIQMWLEEGRVNQMVEGVRGWCSLHQPLECSDLGSDQMQYSSMKTLQNGAGDRGRTGDVQLGKSHVD